MELWLKDVWETRFDEVSAAQLHRARQLFHQYAVTYHCGKDWGEEMVQSVDLGHAVEAAHAIFPSSCRISIREVKTKTQG